MPTLFTDPRSGGVKKSSGVNVLQTVAETWEEVRDNRNPAVDWLIAGFDRRSKTDITVLKKGNGGVARCSSELPHGLACFGGCRLMTSGRFVTFFYADEDTPTMQKGRASMYKNGVLNVLCGSDCEVTMRPGLNEDEALLQVSSDVSTSAAIRSSSATPTKPLSKKKADKPHRINQKTSQIDAGRKTENNADIVSSTQQLEVGNSVPYEILKGIYDPADLPSWVDPLNREEALSEEDFSKVFGMHRKEFHSLPAWKRSQEKKAAGLF
mmetsp:Transcript_48741/g.146879  ORF Transcript_48741/g.146879 Transcript_48741/m.146879 type:complete len:267 (-) Transcript_48741:177-977(-)|eukprot:CAMPEP_0113532754 /NCGR_PEP_ID=MMETSP0015_2-20120614/4231_1 /TAXON_ID=2838 /ORGANISM="Odontella" /LENGTH=266 /DNA_ID=CAMNT_0000431743 /DNA_START=229 /DNA_END=1029 /DNA_ORIENTATION=+ /assembly_acc=CAM_ASM_000160